MIKVIIRFGDGRAKILTSSNFQKIQFVSVLKKILSELRAAAHKERENVANMLKKDYENELSLESQLFIEAFCDLILTGGPNNLTVSLEEDL